MVVYTSDQSNYNPHDIQMILTNINDNKIQNYALNPNPQIYIKVVGDIHRSQWTSDNLDERYWFKITGVGPCPKDLADTTLCGPTGFPDPYFTPIHIYVCFRQSFIIRHNVMFSNDCINPPSKGDIANIRGLNGYWEFVKITYGHNPLKYITKKVKIEEVKPKNELTKNMIAMFKKSLEEDKKNQKGKKSTPRAAAGLCPSKKINKGARGGKKSRGRDKK